VGKNDGYKVQRPDRDGSQAPCWRVTSCCDCLGSTPTKILGGPKKSLFRRRGEEQIPGEGAVAAECRSMG